MLPVELWESCCKVSSLPIDRKYLRGNQGIIIQFYYLIQNINVDGLLWFFCRINTILMQCLKIDFYVCSAQNLGKARVNLTFIPVFKPSTHKLYILRHCTNAMHCLFIISLKIIWITRMWFVMQLLQIFHAVTVKGSKWEMWL